MFGHEHGEDTVAGALLSFARYIGLFVFGLLPLFFVPSVIAPLGYTKILIVVAGLFLAIVFFAFATLRQGIVKFSYSVPILVLWAIFVLSVISALFSGDFLDSFWGTEVGPHSAVFAGFLALTATFWMFVSKEKTMVVRLYLILAFSAVVLTLYHLVRLVFGVDFLTLGVFGGNLVSSPFGEWNSLAVFFGLVVIFSLVALEQLALSSVGRGLFAAVVLTSLVMLAIINFVAVFVVLGLTSLVMIIYSLTRGKFRMTHVGAMRANASVVSISVSLATLLVSILFVIGGSAVGSVMSGITNVSHIEVRPSLSATIGIAKEVYREHALLGIGPNKFVDAWRLHRDPSINSTIFWNTTFESGYGYIPTLFVTTGVVGGLLWVLFFALFMFYGVKTLLQNTHAEQMWYFIALSSFVAGAYLWGISFLYAPGSVLLFLAAACTGIFFGARRALIPESEKSYRLMLNPRSAFVTVSVTVLVVVASVGSMYYIGRHYAAVYLFRTSIVASQNGEGSDAVLARVANAFSLSRDDLFAQQVAAYEREIARGLLASGEGGEEVQQKFQNALTDGINAGRLAVALDGTNPDAWSTLGQLYGTVVPLNIENSYELAREALTKAHELDPQNPSRLVTLAELELLRQDIASARSYATRAIELKSNYTDAIYVLAQIEISDGNVPAAIESTRATTLLDSENPVRHFQLGVLQLSADKPAEAALSLERAVALSPEYSNARYFLAFAYDALGRKAEARKELETVLVANPGNADVETLLARLAAGRSLNEPAAATSTDAGVSGEPIKESSETTATNEPVTSGQAPVSPLLTPVNTDTEAAPAQ